MAPKFYAKPTPSKQQARRESVATHHHAHTFTGHSYSASSWSCSLADRRLLPLRGRLTITIFGSALSMALVCPMSDAGLSGQSWGYIRSRFGTTPTAFTLYLETVSSGTRVGLLARAEILERGKSTSLSHQLNRRRLKVALWEFGMDKAMGVRLKSEG